MPLLPPPHFLKAQLITSHEMFWHWVSVSAHTCTLSAQSKGVVYSIIFCYSSTLLKIELQWAVVGSAEEKDRKSYF